MLPHGRLPSNSCIGRAPPDFPESPGTLTAGPVRYSTSVSGQPVNSDRSLDTRAFIITNPENAANFCIDRDSGRTSVSTLNTSAIQPAHKVESAGFGEDRARAQAGAEGLGYGTSLWTSARVARLIERECAVEYHPGHVWRILRYLEWSSQPRRPGAGAGRSEDPAVGT